MSMARQLSVWFDEIVGAGGEAFSLHHDGADAQTWAVVVAQFSRCGRRYSSGSAAGLVSSRWSMVLQNAPGAAYSGGGVSQNLGGNCSDASLATTASLCAGQLKDQEMISAKQGRCPRGCRTGKRGSCSHRRNTAAKALVRGESATRLWCRVCQDRPVRCTSRPRTSGRRNRESAEVVPEVSSPLTH